VDELAERLGVFRPCFSGQDVLAELTSPSTLTISLQWKSGDTTPPHVSQSQGS